ncbi:MAG: hypothetical protein JST19_23165 [Bacteroidetes bacterium]|nr:hypothetical protein [Bacteroidota bacterium]
MNTIKGLVGFIGLALIFLSSAFAFSQDTTKLRNAIIKRANPDEPGLTAKQAINHVGQDVYVRDTIFKYKIVTNNYKIFYVGDRDTSRSLRVIIKNDKILIEPPTWLMSFGSFSGKVILIGSTPSIIVTKDWQLATRVGI